MRLTGEIMKIITCFKLVPEEQDIVVTPEYTLNFDNADAKISQFDLNAIEAASQLATDDDEIAALTIGGSLLQKTCYPAGRTACIWCRMRNLNMHCLSIPQRRWRQQLKRSASIY